MLRRERGRARRAIIEAATDYRRALSSFGTGSPPRGTWRQTPFDTDPGRREPVTEGQVEKALAEVSATLGGIPGILDGIDSVVVTEEMAEELLKFSEGDPEEFAGELENAVSEARLRITEEAGYTDDVAAFLRMGALVVDSRPGDRFGCLVVDLKEYMPEPELAYIVYDALRAYINHSSSRFYNVEMIFRGTGRDY
ncbi:hypothetical protein [Nocardiopsis potens]|uniref:hypothetical protein n=1 Tax=Nocardiopsis potens TaxID=1246458 RepID=UPI0003472C01|nr:hypothetical protein [Nocardiopsis potens]